MQTILLIEDDDSFRTSLRKVLEKENYKILEAHNGKEGCALTKKESIDLIILDFYLGDMTGADVLDSLQAKTKPPVIVLSANASAEIEQTVRERGVRLSLTKPIRRENLLTAIQSCMWTHPEGESHDH